MPYKSKRTRDLQGEVVAGTGITITEQTKPDGTKEYTITNGDPASAITVDGTGLSLISNVLRNTMAAIMGWSGDDSRGAINWTDDNGDTVLKIIPLEELFIGDAHDNNDFIIKHINGENRLIRGTLQIAENINSTGGVSLNTLVSNVQTLADMANSAATFYCNTYYYGGNLIQSSAIMIIEDTPLNSFFEQNVTPLTFDAGDFVGVLVKKNGVYRYEQRIEIEVNTSASMIDKTLNCDIIAVDENGNYDTLRAYCSIFSEFETNKYYGVIDISTIINIDENLTVGFIVNFEGTNVTHVGTLVDDPILSIQKVR